MAGLFPGEVQRGHAGRVEQHLGLVATRLAPGRDRLGITHLGLLGAGAVAVRSLGFVHAALRRLEPLTGRPDGGRGQRQGQPGQRALVRDHADELAHHAQAAGAGNGALGDR